MAHMQGGNERRTDREGLRSVRGLLQSTGAVRARVIDDHMFAVPTHGGLPATFRLQLFTALGARPVAVATQTSSEGTSLVNAAEKYASAVWQQHCPNDPEPPIWIQRQLMQRDGLAVFKLVTFSVDQPYALSSPEWHAITADEVAQLVGGPVDEDRGDGYVPRPAEAEAEPRYKVFWVWRLPRPKPFRAPECMPEGISWQPRLRRQVLPRQDTSDCCEYHSVNWHRVSRSAIRIARQAAGTGLRGDALADKARDLADAATELTPAERGAAATLVCPAEGIQLSRAHGRGRTGYINGQHRSQAMLDAGVRRTVIVDWESPE